MSLVALVEFGNFRAEMSGDLSGYSENSYADIESSVAPKLGRVDVYQVHHHASRYSSNAAWISAVRPRIGIVSTGVGNTFEHPTEECLERLHTAGVKTTGPKQDMGPRLRTVWTSSAGTLL